MPRLMGVVPAETAEELACIGHLRHWAHSVADCPICKLSTELSLKNGGK